MSPSKKEQSQVETVEYKPTQKQKSSAKTVSKTKTAKPAGQQSVKSKTAAFKKPSVVKRIEDKAENVAESVKEKVSNSEFTEKISEKAEAAKKMQFLPGINLPNKLTIFRVLLVPFYIFNYIFNSYWAALVIFCIASITDFFDGKIARERNLVTNFGKIMDPLADKILVYSAICLFVGNDVVGGATLIIFLAREFVVSGMRTVAASEGKVLAAGMSGKIKTVLQMFAVIVILIAEALRNNPAVLKAGIILYVLSLAMALYSGIEYVIRNKDVFSM